MTLARTLSAQLPFDRSKLAICFYHVQLPPNSVMDAWRGGVPCDYTPMIAASTAAAKATHPDAHLIMFTDRITKFNPLPLQVVRLDLGLELGFERTKTWRAMAECWPGRVIHIDTDICLRRNFAPIYDMYFDFAVTHRNEIPSQPINGGMLLQRSAPATGAFLDVMLKTMSDICAEHPGRTDLRTAGAEQMALARIVNGAGPGKYKTPSGVMAILPCAMVNKTSTIEGQWKEGDDWYADHIKGARKTALI